MKLIRREEISKSIKNTAKKHKMLIPVFNGQPAENVDMDFLVKMQSMQGPNTKLKKTMEADKTFENIAFQDQVKKIENVEQSFALQAHTMIMNAIAYQSRKFTTATMDLFNPIESNPYTVDDDFTLTLHSNIFYDFEHYYVNIFTERWIHRYDSNILEENKTSFIDTLTDFNDIFNIYSYFSNDESVISDINIKYMSMVADKIYRLYNNAIRIRPENIGLKTGQEPVLYEKLQEFLSETYDVMYIVFCKLYLLSKQYLEYAAYDFVKTYADSKVVDNEPEIELVDTEQEEE